MHLLREDADCMGVDVSELMWTGWISFHISSIAEVHILRRWTE